MKETPVNVDQCIEYATISDVGMRRANNQDALNTMVATEGDYWEKRGHLFVVADGMGAHAAGELASKLAADGIIHSYGKKLEQNPHEALQQAIVEANATIHDKGQTDVGFQGMGTTCSTLVLFSHGALIGHVGDSRIYRLRDGQLDQLTFDHSLVWEMRAAGKLASESAEVHLPKNIITRSLGPNRKVQVDLEGPFPVAVGDVYLLCSDGLTGPVKDEELGVILGSLPPEKAVRTLVDLANLRGGPDNITVIVVRVNGPPVASILPEEVRGDEEKRGSPILWGIAAVCLLAAVVMYFLEARLPAMLCGMAAVVAGLVAIIQRFDKQEEAVDEVDPTAIPIGPLGKGPYMTFDCRPNPEVVSELAQVADQLRETGQSVGLNIDWERFERLAEQAAAAVERRDFEAAVRDQSERISLVVAAMKRRDNGRALSDSQVDLF